MLRWWGECTEGYWERAYELQLGIDPSREVYFCKLSEFQICFTVLEPP